MERRATATGFFAVFEVFEFLDPGRFVVAEAARNPVLDVVLDAVLVVDALRDADTFAADECDADECNVDRLATAVLGAVLPAAFDAVWRCADLWCTAVFETACFDAGLEAVSDGEFCAARLPAARSATVIARFETRKRSV